MYLLESAMLLFYMASLVCVQGKSYYCLSQPNVPYSFDISSLISMSIVLDRLDMKPHPKVNKFVKNFEVSF